MLPIMECNSDSRQVYDVIQFIHPIVDKRLKIVEKIYP